MTKALRENWGDFSGTKVVRHLCFDRIAVGYSRLGDPNGGGDYIYRTDAFVHGRAGWYDEGAGSLAPTQPSDTANAPILAAALYTVDRYFRSHKHAGADR